MARVISCYDRHTQVCKPFSSTEWWHSYSNILPLRRCQSYSLLNPFSITQSRNFNWVINLSSFSFLPLSRVGFITVVTSQCAGHLDKNLNVFKFYSVFTVHSQFTPCILGNVKVFYYRPVIILNRISRTQFLPCRTSRSACSSSEIWLL